MKSLQVLLLDNNLEDADLIKATLRQGAINCELLRVETRSDFVAALDNNVFDLVLADFAVPDINGLSALEIACKISPDVPFIFVSSSLDEELEIVALKNGATDYVLKQRIKRLVPSVIRALQQIRDISERKCAELNAKFLDKISQDLVDIDDVDKIVQLVGEKLWGYINTSSCVFTKINLATDEALIEYNWHQDNIPSLVGAYRISEFVTDEFLIAVQTGKPIVVRNVNTDKRVFDAQRFHKLKIGAELNIPLIRDGEWKFSFTVFHSQPYNWHDDEIKLMQELANRIFQKLERTRVETALRESEEKYRTLFESIDQGFCICEVLFDENDKPIDYRFLVVNPVFEALTGLREAAGKTISSLVPNIEAFWFEIYGRVVKTGEPVRFENQSNVMNRWFDINAFPLGEPQSHKLGILFTNTTARKKIEQERERFLAVGSDLQVVVGIDGYFKWASPTFERMLGWTVDEMTSRPWTDFLHPDDIARTEAEIERVLSGNKSFAFENRYRHKDGSQHWLLWNAQSYPKEQVVYAVAVDITERKIAEIALIESEKQSRNILESIKDGFLALDFNWEFTYVNQAAEHLLDCNAGALLGKNFWEWFPGLADTKFGQLHRRVMRNRVAESLTAFYPDHNRWYEVNSYPANNGITIFFRNITDSKQAEEALRQSESRFRLMVESAKEYAIFTLDLNGIISSWNSGAERVLGYTEAVAIGCSGRLIFTPEDNDINRAEQEMELALTEGRAENERWHIRSNGSRFWASGLMMPLLSEAGNVQGFVKILQDKTEQRQAHEQIQQQAQQLQQANRIKDEFLAVLSHELRSPLNPILGWSKLLQTGKLDSSKTAQALNAIERNAKLQSELIEDLLDVSRILQGKLSLSVHPVDLAPTIEAAMETVQLAAQAKSIQINAKFEPNIGQVSGDANRLQQIVWNLLSNAVKFTDVGGQVSIALKHLGNTAQIIVSDNGKGINPGFLPYIFDYFRQEDGSITRKFGGLGLGLAIVRHLVELHGGTVYAESLGEGQGANFTVTLPLIPNSCQTNVDNKASESSLNLDGITVLVVDDNTDTLEFIASMLSIYGASVTAVNSGAEALATIVHNKPDILVSDIGMPDMDGYTLIQQLITLAPQYRTIPTIALTAFAGEINQKQALQAGFQRHLSKPIEPQLLITTIKELFNASLMS
ncbi:hypothetical protein DSM106972_091420 [Dulcicalothrix desertica PCC 7102]|uniref:histidine kinase n=2 Tax=Dulcicalothrix desertica TaxID=32056 RepID=A0A3S1BU88_9CYAN|nr:PAS domain S-box protein [Dulcicalothrix desertica]RUS94982.1 hypothetical protein DSM106972_091420 [Dulcicalothrix desertica PCC 7102]TWH51439.1 PAS domain S-box-containing protein [Dulcicalothrix desertica PCC 7102]